MTSFDAIKVRALTEDEFKSLTPDDLIYVESSEFTVPILEPAHYTGNRYYLEQGSLQVKTVYGTETHRKVGAVYVADDSGAELPLIRTAGTRVSSALFFPDLTEEEAKERLYKALRAEFGAGVVQVWNIRTGPVRDIHKDVYAAEQEWVTTGKKGAGKLVETNRRLLARGVLDGHDSYFMNGGEPGERVVVELHTPSATETI